MNPSLRVLYKPPLHNLHSSYQDREKMDQAGSARRSLDPRKVSRRGWEENDFLPPGWWHRKPKPGSSSRQIQVLSPEGRRFTSYKGVLEHLRSHEMYSQVDIERMKRFPDGVLKERVGQEQKISVKEYQGALARGETGPELENIRNQLRSRGWREDGRLVPRGWMFRQRPGLHHIDFITEMGEQLKSVRDANKYLVVNKFDFIIDAKLCREAFVDNYELELRRIEKNSNLEKPVAQPVLPAGITLRKVAPEKTEESDRDMTPLPTMFQHVFKRLENFRKNTALRCGATRLKSIDDDFDSL